MKKILLLYFLGLSQLGFSQIFVQRIDTTQNFKRNFAAISMFKPIIFSDDGIERSSILSISMPLCSFHERRNYRTSIDLFMDFHSDFCDSFIKAGARLSFNYMFADKFIVKAAPGLSIYHDKRYTFGLSNQLAVSYNNRFDIVAQYDLLRDVPSELTHQISLGAKLSGSKFAPFIMPLVGLVGIMGVAIGRSK